MASADTQRPIASRGLTSPQAADRLVSQGPNSVAGPQRRRVVTRVVRQLVDPLVLLLFAALVVTVALGDVTDAIVIAFVVVVNTAIGVAQEVRADRAIAALDTLAAPTARVVRDGTDIDIPAAGVVRGDLVRLQTGDIVPADLALTVAHRLQVDESALTGESVPVARGVGDEVRAGTVVVVGRAAGTAVRTGSASGLGRIAAVVAATRPGPTPLQRRLASLSRVLGLGAVVLSGLVFGIGLLSGRPVIGMAITAVSLVVAAVPESLPAVVTLSLALAARRMAAHHAIPRRLHAVETLGSVTVVASDKTGTLTEGRMAVQTVIDATRREFTVTGHGYEPTGTVQAREGPSTPVPGAVVELARAGLLCGDAALVAPTANDRAWRSSGDPLEAALVAFAARCGLSPDAERAAWPRIAEQPFEQETRRMTTVHRGPDGRILVVCKGSPETVLTRPLLSDSPDVLAQARKAADQCARTGLRVLAVAAATVSELPSVESPTNLRYLGLVAVGDPVRDNAASIVREFHDAGIRLILVTGDHPGTAAAVGSRIGIWHDGDDVHRGDAGSPEPDQADRVHVFARTQPEQKLDIVTAL